MDERRKTDRMKEAPGMVIREYVTPQGCRVRTLLAVNDRSGLLDETVVLSASTRIDPAVQEARRRRAVAFQ